MLLGPLDAEPSITEPFELDLQLVALQFVGRRCGRVQQVVDTRVLRDVGAETHTRDAGFLTQVVDSDEGSAVPVAAVGQHGGQAGVEHLPRTPPDLGRLAPAPDQPLHPVEQ